ncbi:hypothetical protein F2Q68_00022281 [Brassica cretica]|uniref:Uncharacterized protein n=1 Tax=Brassica cretica TaxID=69181 RepID=A0A8S9FY96_BRACR|nr:hypothetical protein F2Q68_00022281 [Brassica cretica]
MDRLRRSTQTKRSEGGVRKRLLRIDSSRRSHFASLRKEDIRNGIRVPKTEQAGMDRLRRSTQTKRSEGGVRKRLLRIDSSRRSHFASLRKEDIRNGISRLIFLL